MKDKLRELIDTLSERVGGDPTTTISSKEICDLRVILDAEGDGVAMELPRYRAIGFDAETNCAEMVADPDGAWVHVMDLPQGSPARSGVVSDEDVFEHLSYIGFSKGLDGEYAPSTVARTRAALEHFTKKEDAMSAEYSVEEVLATAKWCRENSSGIYRKSAIAADMLTDYADTLSKPADSGRAGDEMVDIAMKAAYAFDTTERLHIDYDTMEVALEAALAAQGQGEPVAWQVRIGSSDIWGGCHSKELADFYGRQSGMRYETRPLYTHPAPAASPAGVPDALRVWAMAEGAPAGDPMYEAARGHVREMLKAAPSAPEGDGGAE